MDFFKKRGGYMALALRNGETPSIDLILSKENRQHLSRS